MLAYPIAIAAVLMGVDAKSSSSSSPTITHRHKLDFMRAMKTDARSQQRRRKLTEETQKEFKNTLYGNTNESKSLRKKLMSKAKVVEPGSDMHRKLNGEVEEKKDDTTTRKLNYQDQTDDYYSMQGQWANGFTFDAAQFSLSYNRCAAVRQFDDELAAQEDSMDVFATKQYAIFRFCPEATCMGYVDDMEQCGCEEQCQWHGDGGNGNGENNEEQCEEACEAQCHAFQKCFPRGSGLNRAVVVRGGEVRVSRDACSFGSPATSGGVFYTDAYFSTVEGGGGMFKVRQFMADGFGGVTLPLGKIFPKGPWSEAMAYGTKGKSGNIEGAMDRTVN